MLLKYITNIKLRLNMIACVRNMGKFHEEHRKGGYHGDDPINHNFKTIKKV